MNGSTVDDLTFLMGAMTCITGSLDIQESLIETFDYLADHFPIEAISLHQYSVRLESLKLYFLVRKGQFDFVETTVPVDKENVPILSLHEKGLELIRSIPKSRENQVTFAHSKSLESLMKYKERAYLIGILRLEDKTIGHLCFMGTHENCFSKEHERKLSLLLNPFAMTMANLLRYRRTIEFQKKLYAEKDKLQKDLELIRDRKVIGGQAGLRNTMVVVNQLHGSEIPALILGETGTGKELIADIIQGLSARAGEPFVKVNCGAIPETLIDSELFGYEKGAFTGATATRAGKFEQAHGGTLFLDEVGELPLQAQVRLLRVLQNGVIERLGSTRPINIDVRIIAATNRNLEQMITERTFREDLYYRLYVFPIHLPPLRDRVEDIPELINLFAKRAYSKLQIKGHPNLPTSTLQCLAQYYWPGNVRELENLVKRCITMTPGGPLNLDELLPKNDNWYVTSDKSTNNFEKRLDERIEELIGKQLSELSIQPPQPQLLSKACSTNSTVKTLDEAIKDAINTALEFAHGKVNGAGGAADILAVNPNTLRSKMRKLGISPKIMHKPD